VRWKETGYIVYADFFRNLSFVMRARWYERSFALLIDRFQPTVFWDVGANIGLYSLLFLSRNSDGKVLAFEPDGRNVDLLSRTASRNALPMKIVTKALDRHSGEVVFFIDDVTGATGTIVPDNFFLRNEFGAKVVRSTVVRTTTLDEQLQDNEGPDLIKIDVEGADLAVLEGGRRMLERFLPIVCYEATNFNQTKRLLEDLGYKLFDGRTLQAIEGGAYEVAALHRRKHLSGQNVLDISR
jgi:FkbM family methyltransferase